MGQPAAKQGDQVMGTCVHILMLPGPVSPIPTPIPHMFSGTITGNCSPDVKVMGMPAATLGSTADNTPHIPMGPGPFAIPPRNKGLIMTGSPNVFINGKPAARASDTALICADPVDIPAGSVVAISSVMIA